MYAMLYFVILLSRQRFGRDRNKTLLENLMPSFKHIN